MEALARHLQTTLELVTVSTVFSERAVKFVSFIFKFNTKYTATTYGIACDIRFIEPVVLMQFFT